jgi:hypothetical protein
MSATGKRLGFALLFTAGVTIFNVYMVLMGAAGGLYDHLPGAAPQHETQAPSKGAQIHEGRFFQTAWHSIRANYCRAT